MYSKKRFDLSAPQGPFELLFEIYNMAGMAIRQTALDLKSSLIDIRENAEVGKLAAMTSRFKTTEQSESGEQRQSEVEDVQMHDAIHNAGYTLAWHHLSQDGENGFQLVYPVRYLMSVYGSFVTVVVSQQCSRVYEARRTRCHHQASQTPCRDKDPEISRQPRGRVESRHRTARRARLWSPLAYRHAQLHSALSVCSGLVKRSRRLLSSKTVSWWCDIHARQRRRAS